MPFGFWVLGNRAAKPEGLSGWIRSQMPFGFWVLGNAARVCLAALHIWQVSNAFRLLGSGELKPSTISNASYGAVSNAFRLLGSGELDERQQRQGRKDSVSNAFRLLGSGELMTQDK